MSRRTIWVGLGTLWALTFPPPASADQLYQSDTWPAFASDRKASAVGDGLIVTIYEATQASSKLENNSSRKSQIGGGVQAGSANENANLQFGGSYAGTGEVVRSEQFVAQMSVTVTEVLPHGDLRIEGQQHMLINGEATVIEVRGRVRPEDITPDNAVLSSRISDAQIDYDGKGFVSRSAKPGLISRLFSFLGLG